MNFIEKPKKSLGQNFLIDNNIVNKIINIVDINENKTILEIGPGYGSLTNKIVSLNPKKLFAIEKDKKLYFLLKENFKNHRNVEIINNDILNLIDKSDFGKKLIVFGNLPYSVSTQILASFIMLKKWPPWFDELVFMFQKEVADRIVAKPNTREFGRLSVLCHWRLEIKKHFDVSRNCFSPKPKVSSTVISFKPKKNKFYLKNPKNLEIITRLLFSNKRKMINKSFNRMFGKKNNIAEDLNLNLEQRPGELSCEMYYKIAMKYENLFC